MVDKTDNHEYNVPNEGETDWHLPLNENFENYDTDIEIRDKESNRSNYDPKAGAKFLATDTERVFLGDGSSWTPLESTSKLPRFEQVSINDSGIAGPSLWVNGDGGNGINVTTNQGYALFADGSDAKGAIITKGSIRVGKDDGASFVPVVEVDGDLNDDAARVRGVEPSPSGSLGVSDLRLGLTEAGDLLTLTTTSNSREYVGVGRSEPITPSSGFGLTTSSSGDYAGMYVDAVDGSDQPFYGYAVDGNERAWHYWDESDGVWKLTFYEGYRGEDKMWVTADGDVEAKGNKNFVQSVDTDDGEKEVVYTASEAPTPHTELSGVAELEDGRAAVELPDHFGWVTDDDEPIVVQITPYGGELGTRVVERSTDRFVVEDLEGEGDYEFAYTVKGTREGQADKEVVRDPAPDRTAGETGGPTPADD